MQGSMHKHTPGYGFGACIVTNDGYYAHCNTPTSLEGRKKRYVREPQTHRSAMSYGRAIPDLEPGATARYMRSKLLTSSQVGGWWKGSHDNNSDTLSTARTSLSQTNTARSVPCTARSVGSGPSQSVRSAGSAVSKQGLQQTGSARSAASTARSSPAATTARSQAAEGLTGRSTRASSESFGSSAPSSHRTRPINPIKSLDSSFDRYRKYDLLAATTDGPVTNRYGMVRGSEVVSMNASTSELSETWSHVLRGLKY
ncbi:unnamed protein product [Chrysoparadoxa australica]